jgi:flagellar hook-associated protein 2
MALTSSGIGSGLDVDTIITQLMSIEKQPLTRLQAQETTYNAKLTAYGTLKSSLSTFQTAVKGLTDVSKYSSTAATIADTNIASATVAPNASVGNYSLEVSKLAQGQKLATAGQASVNAPIGTGTLTFDFGTVSGTLDPATGTYNAGASYVSGGSGVKTITLTNENSTLAGLRDTINNAKMGVTATIVNDGGASPYRLVLSTATGAANSMKISATGDPSLAALMTHDPAGAQALSEKQTAQNAEFKIDGIAVSKANNTVDDAIAGVTLTLKKTNVGTPTSVNVAVDLTGITTAVKGFVDGYNTMTKSLRSLTAYDDVAKKASVLTGDAVARNIQTALRGIFSTDIGGGVSSFSALTEIGVSLQKDGTLAVDNTKLQKAITENAGKIPGLFAAVGNATDAMVSYSSTTAKTKPGTYAVEVSRLATQGTLSGSAAASTTITAGVNDTLTVLLDNQTETITLGAGSYASADALAAEIQTKINGVAKFSGVGSTISATQTGGVLSLLSKRYGSTSRIEIVGGNGMTDLFGTPASVLGVDVEGKINGVTAFASGQNLTGATGDASDGLRITIAGGAPGARGNLTFSQGFATRFDALIASQLDSAGPIASRTTGIAASIKTLDQNQDALTLRLQATEKRLRAQYTALDTTMSNLTATGNSLAAQLTGLQSYL